MTESAEKLIQKELRPSEWMYSPPQDHPVWIKWHELFGLEPPSLLKQKINKFVVHRGWRDIAVIHYDDYLSYAKAYYLQVENTRLRTEAAKVPQSLDEAVERNPALVKELEDLRQELTWLREHCSESRSLH